MINNSANAWPAATLAAQLRSLNHDYMQNSPDNTLRGKDYWPNRQPERFTEELADAQKHGVFPASPGDADFEKIVSSGARFNWAVLLDGSLKVTPSVVITEDGPVRISHAILVPDGHAVLAAGEARADAFLSNTTGHYKNEAFVLPPVREAFEKLGMTFKR